MEQDNRFSGGRLSFKEVPINIAQSILREYWESHKNLSRIRGIEVLWYFFNQGLRNVFVLPASNAVAIVTISLSLFLLSGFLVSIQNIESAITGASDSLSFTAYFKDSTGEAEINQFLQLLENQSSVLSLKFYSKQDALGLLSADLGINNEFLVGLEKDNPLPASVDIRLRPREVGIENISSVIEKIRSNPIVEDLVYGSQWIDQMKNLLVLVRVASWGVLSLILGIVVFIISNTIRLILLTRKDEIGIMRLVGATPLFVKIPFVLGGIFQGLLGAALSLVSSVLLFSFVKAEISGVSIFGTYLPRLHFLSPFWIFGLLFLGASVGGLGSLFAVRKFVDV